MIIVMVHDGVQNLPIKLTLTLMFNTNEVLALASNATTFYFLYHDIIVEEKKVCRCLITLKEVSAPLLQSI